MPWLCPYPVLIWAIVFIPITYLVWKLQPNNKLTTLLLWLDYLLVNFFFFESVNWVIVNYWIRLIPVAAVIVIGFRYLVGWKHDPFLPKQGGAALLVTGVCAVVLVIVGFIDFRVLQSTDFRSFAGKPMLAQMPLRNGLYVVANGGNGQAGIELNTDPYKWFAPRSNPTIQTDFSADIFKMTTGGTIASGYMPDSHLEYEIFDDFVYSPCVGQVVYVEDGHPDVDLSGKADTVLGNYIVIQCAEYFVTLSNLGNDTMLVKTGDRVRLTMMIAHVGSSGIPSIPHLHIQANMGSWKGDDNAVPILFEGIFAVDQFAFRNKIYLPQN